LGRTKAEKQVKTKGKPRKKGLPWFIWLAIAVSIVAIVAYVRTSPAGGPSGSTQSGELNAAIIDQLYTLQANQGFIQQASRELEDCGFKVDVYRGREVTVDLYRRLPTFGYELIILRAHSGVLQRGEGSASEETATTFLFTDEAYSQTKHVLEQLSDQIVEAQIEEGYPHVFAVKWRFILESMRGEFQDTIIVMMGCSTTQMSHMAEAFVLKGASTCMGWDAAVDLGYVDRATLNLVGNLCARGMAIEQAVAATMTEVGPDSSYNAYLKYYPGEAGGKTIEGLFP
jgi:hypothetical protein